MAYSPVAVDSPKPQPEDARRRVGYARIRVRKPKELSEATRSNLLRILNRLPIKDPLWTTIMKLGYARVSTEDQNLSIQVEALKSAGCERIYREKISGHTQVRPELIKLLDHLRSGDTVIVTRLDRLARNTRDLIETVERIGQTGAGILSLAEPWADTTTSAGKMIMTIFAGIAEFERALILERTEAGRKAARKNGTRFGRPPLMTREQQQLALRLLNEGKTTGQVAKTFQVHAETIRRLNRRQKAV